jgi:diguanylate cyclase (GGDEF)-like protein
VMREKVWQESDAGSNVSAEGGLLDGVLSAIPEPFFVYDEDGTYLDVLGGSDRTKYHDAAHLKGKNVHEVMPAVLADLILNKVRESIAADKVITCEYAVNPSDIDGYEGTPGPTGLRWFEAHISPVRPVPGEKRKVVWIAFDITDYKETMEQLNRQREQLDILSRTDPLTGLLNRRSFFEQAQFRILTVKMEKKAHIWLMMLDLDHFKLINDRFGHHVGDECLKVFAGNLQSFVGTSMIIGRLGGEEFGIITTAETHAEAYAQAEDIRQKTAGTYVQVDAIEIRLTVSIGLTRLEYAEKDIIEGLKRADDMMYRAKKAGRNQIYFAQ